jgi:D-glycerate 3-kinase
MRYCLAMVADPHVPAAGGFPEPLVSAALEAALALPAAVPVFAIAGLQGSGKSTLAAQMAALAGRRGRTAAVVSIDDFYLGKAQRARLARDVHPLLATRGPPGTHDVGFACATLDALKQRNATSLPRFDKLADDTAPRASWPQVTAADLVIVEGWLLGTPAEDDAALAVPVNALERDEDSQGHWRRYCNEALRNDYPALWQRFDALWFLQPPGFEVVADWRWQQEQQMAREQPGKPAMDYAQVQRFIGFFERVSRQALRTLPDIADRTIPLDAQRNLIKPVGAT